MVERKGRQKKESPQERTSAFFDVEVDALAKNLIGKTIASVSEGKVAVITRTQAWNKDDNKEKRYQPIHELPPGHIYVSRFPLRRMDQTLVVAKSEGQTGGCVALLRINYINFQSTEEEFLEEIENGDDNFMQREGDIARYFNLQSGEIAKLEFLDKRDILFIARTGIQIEPGTTPEVINPEDADADLKALLE